MPILTRPNPRPGSPTRSVPARMQFFTRAKQHATSPLKPIKVSHHQLGALSDWHKEDPLEIRLATKPGYRSPNFPILHSAIALYNPKATEKTHVILGRQVTHLQYDLVTLFRRGLEIKSEKVNEREFLDKKLSFTVYPTGVLFVQDEVIDVFKLADELIIKHPYNLINANCYSYSVTAMSLAVEKLLARPVCNADEVSRILSTMEKNALTFGVLNNKAVAERLIDVCSAIKTRFAAKPQQPLADKKLLAQCAALVTKIDGYNTTHPLELPSDPGYYLK